MKQIGKWMQMGMLKAHPSDPLFACLDLGKFWSISIFETPVAALQYIYSPERFACTY